MRHARRKFQMCGDCKNRLKSENPDNGQTEIPEIVNSLEEKLTPKQLARRQRLQQKHAQKQLPQAHQQPEQQPIEKKSIFKRFGESEAGNLAAIRSTGKTTLMEDLSDMGKMMYDSMASFGEEELNNLHRRTGAKRKESDNDSYGG